jgi:hypothetical protein
VKRFALHEAAFVVFEDVKISLALFVYFLGDAKKKSNLNLNRFRVAAIALYRTRG